MSEPASAHDRAVVAAQLGRFPRGTRAVAHRCPCGLPDAVETTPRLADGTPFPTLFYLTCPRATAACSRLESNGTMRTMSARLSEDPDLAAGYLAAHEDYLARRTAIMEVPEIEGTSAGGMPSRVKCLHVALAHRLGAGPGVNPIGDEVYDLVEPWWHAGPCVIVPDPDAATDPAATSDATAATDPAATDPAVTSGTEAGSADAPAAS